MGLMLLAPLPVRPRRNALVAVAIACSVLLPITAFAGPKRNTAEPMADNEMRANGIYQDAKKSFDANDFQKAWELATEAEKIFAHPAIVLMRGRTARKLGHLREAEDAFRRADSPQLPKPLVRTLNDERQMLNDELHIKGELVVQVQPSNAVISVDGDTQKGSYAKWILAGKHKVELVAPEFRPVVRTVEVTAGDTQRIKVELARQGGTLIVVVPGGLQGVDILLDGKLLELTPESRIGDRAPPVNVLPGKHEVVCARGPQRVAKALQVELDAVVDVRCEGVEPPTHFPTKPVLGWTGVAVGAGMLSYGAWGLASYQSDKSDPRWNPTSTSNKPVMGTVYAVTGVAAGVLSYLFLARGSDRAADEKTARATDAPWPLPHPWQGGAVSPHPSAPDL